MTWIKVKEMSSIENELLHETIMKLKLYANEHGKDDNFYKTIHSQAVDLAKRIVGSDNIVIPVILNTEEPIVVMVELEMLDDGNSYRVIGFEQGEDDGDDNYVKIVVND